jgi:hypothetical protein
MKNLKKVIILLPGGVFIAIAAINVKLGHVAYDKISSSSFTLDAVANGESWVSESGGPFSGESRAL